MRAIYFAVIVAVLIAAPAFPAAEAPSGDASATAVKKDSAPKSFTEPANREVAAGIALIKHGDYRKAVLLLREVVKATPDDLEANFYLGVALNRLSEKEAESVLKRSLMEMPESPYVNFELGIFYYGREIDAEAGDYFENVLTLNPGSEYAVQAREYLKKIEERGKEKRWELNLLAGMQYDSNVMVIGDGPLPAGVSRKSDWNGMINAKGSYFLIKDQETELTGSYSIYQTLHTSLTGFDVTQNVLDVSLVQSVAEKLKLKAGYSFEYLFLGGNRYDHAHVLAPGLIFNFEQWGSMVLDYKYRTTSYINSGAFTTNTDRNGDNHYFGITHTVPVGKSYSVWGGYSHDEDLTRQEFWNYHGDRVAAGLRATLPYNSLADLSGEYYHKGYVAEDPSFPGAARDDDQFTVTLTLMKVLSPTFTLMAMEQYTRDISNIGAFNTVRTVTSLFINARF
jgi:tetratricopeptide (TPR) repeat protein